MPYVLVRFRTISYAFGTRATLPARARRMLRGDLRIGYESPEPRVFRLRLSPYSQYAGGFGSSQSTISLLTLKAKK